eukprot:1162046-Pelagomonas_calceolata.AAC.1
MTGYIFVTGLPFMPELIICAGCCWPSPSPFGSSRSRGTAGQFRVRYAHTHTHTSSVREHSIRTLRGPEACMSMQGFMTGDAFVTRLPFMPELNSICVGCCWPRPSPFGSSRSRAKQGNSGFGIHHTHECTYVRAQDRLESSWAAVNTEAHGLRTTGALIYHDDNFCIVIHVWLDFFLLMSLMSSSGC